MIKNFHQIKNKINLPESPRVAQKFYSQYQIK